MVDNTFFEETLEQSEVKARIVSKYFLAWARVITPSAKTHDKRVAYIDLFAGPGRYKDGTRSTPLLVLEKAIENRDLCQMLVSVFNDRDEENVRSLQQAIDELPGIEKLKHKPRVEKEEVGEAIVNAFEAAKLVPTFFFVDPWGYKGLSLGLIESIIKDWGCDCVFFFNYNRINMGLMNPLFKEHLDALFGTHKAEDLRVRLQGLEPEAREALILAGLSDAIRELGGRFVLTFRFRTGAGRLSHHLVFVTKGRKGYDIMKEIMAKEGTVSLEGVPSFEQSEAAAKSPSLFYATTPLGELEASLLEEFAGRTETVSEIFDQHNVGRPFVRKNYKDVLLTLEERGLITTDPSKRKKGTLADHVKVAFPRRR